MRLHNRYVSILLGLSISFSLTTPANSAKPVDSSELRAAVTLGAVRAHQLAFQNAADANGGTRDAGSPGYDASADYIASQLLASGYEVEYQTFSFISSRSLGPSLLEQTSPGAVVYGEEVDYNVMSESDGGDVTALTTAVDLDLGPDNASTSGCETDDFTGFPAGHIALIQRGACSFQQKAENAATAGAVGAIIFNQGNTDDRKGLINATLSAEYTGGIPVMFATYDRGVEWSGTDNLELRLFANVLREEVITSNVIGETPGGRDDRVVVVGAHLDSVPEGPGVQDNGSGSGAILEIALQLSSLNITPRNKVRFAWWGAEEAGLVGSQYYIDNLSARDIKNIALNLNFDMIGSPNFVRFVYDGDGSATPDAGPNGSAVIEQVFLDYFADEAGGLATEPTAFDGRSDYGPFIERGIPAGGLFTGAEGIKTEEQAAIYGGTAGDQYDPCYHLACDTYDNISLQALDEMSDAAAHSVLTFAMTTSSINGTDKASNKSVKAAKDFEFLGNHYRK